MATDWLMLQDEYLHTPITLKALARKHGVPSAALSALSTREGWAAMKRAERLLQPAVPDTPSANTEDSAAQSQARETPASHQDRMARLMAIGDQLTDQLARAAVELDKQVLKHKRKTREVVYDGADAKGKPVEENVEEKFELEIVDATVNCAGLQKLSATLKNLRDAARADDGDGQSVGMVAELMKRLDGEAAGEDA